MATPPTSRDHSAHLVQRFAGARARGDRSEMRRTWDELMPYALPRIEGFVAAQAWRFRLSSDEQQEAISLALHKFSLNMIWTFAGGSTGEWAGALRALSIYACMDIVRDAKRDSDRHAPLTSVHEDGSVELTADAAARILRDHQEQATEAEAEEDDSLLYATGRDFLDWALPQLTDGRRAVIELEFEGLDTAATTERLQISRDAVYQNRCRALKDLGRLRLEWESQR